MATWEVITGRSVRSVQSATDSAPTGAEAGLNLSDVSGFSVHVWADTGQTFSGVAGSLVAYLYDDIVGDWSRAPELDLTLPSAATGLRKLVFTGFTVASPRGRLAHIASGIQVTSGGLTLTYSASTLYGDRT
jgi:hypothetical protein